MNIQRKQQGFTLIELMIVIAILAILLAIAIPAYQDYTIRTKVSECVNASAPLKLAVAETQISRGGPTNITDAGEYGIDTTATGPIDSLQYCSGVAVTQGGDFTVTADTTEVGATAGTIAFQFVPTYTANVGVEWECNWATTPATHQKYLPAECRTAPAAN